jgi:hypothetical protein
MSGADFKALLTAEVQHTLSSVGDALTEEVKWNHILVFHSFWEEFRGSYYTQSYTS